MTHKFKSEVQAEFALNILMMLSRISIDDFGGDEWACDYGVRQDQIRMLQELSTRDLQQLALLGKVNFISVRIDPEALDSAVTLSKRRSQEYKLVTELLTKGASLPIINQLFGYSAAQIVALKKSLSLPSKQGRPTALNEPELNKLWNAWLKIRDKPLEIPYQLLELHNKTGLLIMSIWPHLQQWANSESSGRSVVKVDTTKVMRTI